MGGFGGVVKALLAVASDGLEVERPGVGIMTVAGVDG
jgi:hypothetical protein